MGYDVVALNHTIIGRLPADLVGLADTLPSLLRR